jgi:hypothetical protein
VYNVPVLGFRAAAEGGLLKNSQGKSIFYFITPPFHVSIPPETKHVLCAVLICQKNG